MATKQIEKLREKLVEIAYLGSAVAVLNWDRETNMPPKGSDARALSISHLSAVIHDKFIKIDEDELLTDLKNSLTRTLCQRRRHYRKGNMAFL